MPYKKLLLESPKLKNSEIFKAIEMAIPSREIEAAILKTKAKEKRHRGLPSQLVVCLIVAMSFWSRDSMRDVLKNLLDGLNEVWLKTGKYWKTPCKAAITKARKRLGQECNEPVVSSVGTTNGYNWNSGSFSEWIESCSNRWNLLSPLLSP